MTEYRKYIKSQNAAAKRKQAEIKSVKGVTVRARHRAPRLGVFAEACRFFIGSL
jgi:hypothetical protein